MLEDEKSSGATVLAAEDFDPEVDAKRMKFAMTGSGTDEDAILRIIAGRSYLQLLEIAEKFKACYGEELVDSMKGELGGNLEKVCVKRMQSRWELIADRARWAMKGMGTNDNALCRQICPRLPAEIEKIKATYKKMFDRDLEKDVKSETGSDYEKLLVAVLSAGREPENDPDQGLAQSEAQKLYKAGEGKWGTDESTFNRIIAMRSYRQLQATFNAYKTCSDKTIEQAIKSEMGGDLERAMLHVVKAARNRPRYFATEIYETMAGCGTDEDDLIQLIVEHCEVDMKQIKKEFALLYKKALGDWVKNDVSGDLERVLMALIGDKDLGEFPAGYGMEE